MDLYNNIQKDNKVETEPESEIEIDNDVSLFVKKKTTYFLVKQGFSGKMQGKRGFYFRFKSIFYVR